MFTVTSTTTRQSTATPWFADTTDGAYLKAANNDPLLISTELTGEDTLTRVLKLNFNSYDDYQSWIGKIIDIDNTSLVKRNDYVVANSMTLKIEESVDGGAPVIEKII